jgi:parvulin-like peptidyl-prolyl isomerase
VSQDELEQFLAGLGLPPLAQLHEEATYVKRQWLHRYLEDCLKVKKFLDSKVTSGLNVSEEEVRAAYEANLPLYSRPTRYRLRQIRVQSLRDSRNLNRRLRRDGSNFEAIAAELNNAADPESDPEVQGRELGVWTADQLPEAFALAIAELKPGRVTSAIEDPDGGYNYFQLIERLDGYVLPFEDVKDRVRQRLVRDSGADLVDAYVSQARAQARVEIVHENLDFSYVPPGDESTAPPAGKEPKGES